MIQCKSFTKKLFIVPMLFITLFSIFSNARAMYAEHQTINGIPSNIHSLQFSTQGSLNALFLDGTLITLTQEGQRLVKDKTIKIENECNFKFLAISIDGRTIASVSRSIDNIVTILSFQNEHWTEVQTLTGHENEITSIAFSPYGTAFFSSSAEKTIIWNLQDGKWNETQTIETEYPYSSYHKASFSPDNTSFAAASEPNNEIEIWTLQENETWIKVQNIILPSFALSIVFSPNGKTLAFGLTNKTTMIFTLENDEWKEIQIITHNKIPSSPAAFSQDGTTLAIASEKTISLWILQENGKWEESQTITDHSWPIPYFNRIVFSPDKSIYAFSVPSKIQIWRKTFKGDLDLLHNTSRANSVLTRKLIKSMPGMPEDPLHNAMKKNNYRRA